MRCQKMPTAAVTLVDPLFADFATHVVSAFEKSFAICPQQQSTQLDKSAKCHVKYTTVRLAESCLFAA